MRTGGRGVAFLAATGLAACAAVAPGAGSGYDGRYVGDLTLLVAASPEECPRTYGEPATMTVRGGHARIDLPRAMNFTGDVDRDGSLLLSSAGGRLAFITGRIAGDGYVAQGNGVCQYQVRLTKQAA